MKQNLSKKYKYFKIVTMLLLAVCTATMTGLVTYSLATQQTPEMSGNVSFTATGVNAKVTYKSNTGITFKDGVTTPSELEYSTTKTISNADALTTWTGMTIAFDATTKTATLTFTITQTGGEALYVQVVETETPDSEWLTITSTYDTAAKATANKEEAVDVTVTFTADPDKIEVDSSTAFTIKVTITTEDITSGQ